ncbi:hypothetical protein L1887_03739 [Cichorium endivia]|nr:hypothetical protein L1887_03739 [Cichorium endivia]
MWGNNIPFGAGCVKGAEVKGGYIANDQLRDFFNVLSLLSIYLPPPYLLLSNFHPNRCPRNIDILYLQVYTPDGHLLLLRFLLLTNLCPLLLLIFGVIFGGSDLVC